MSGDYGQCLSPASAATSFFQRLSDEHPWLSALVVVTALILILQQLASMHIFYWIKLFFEYLIVRVPLVHVEMTAAESSDDGIQSAPVADCTNLQDPNQPDRIQCFDPSTRQYLGSVPAMTKDQVHAACARARAAQAQWALTTFAQRRAVLRTLQRYITHHVADICRVSSRDSGKAQVDALLGEVLTTCEKIRTVNAWGELWLRPESRPTGPMMMHTIAPWNYPFHNMVNHVISGLMAGNAVVGKVSEHCEFETCESERMSELRIYVFTHQRLLL
jgi:delta 1-pyrroline-5-carboxylate dehydrogenase